MLLLPATVTAKEANDTRRLLAQAMKGEPRDAVLIDASNLQHFDSAALAVLLDCARAADASGKTFALRHVPPQLAALAGLYGVDTVLMAEPEAAPAPATP